VCTANRKSWIPHAASAATKSRRNSVSVSRRRADFVYLKYAVTRERRSGGRRDLACFAFLESAGPIDRSRYVISRPVIEFAMNVRAIRGAWPRAERATA
jgi:hypothetical protein